jgi:hypothetical protein
LFAELGRRRRGIGTAAPLELGGRSPPRGELEAIPIGQIGSVRILERQRGGVTSAGAVQRATAAAAAAAAFRSLARRGAGAG